MEETGGGEIERKVPSFIRYGKHLQFHPDPIVVWINMHCLKMLNQIESRVGTPGFVFM